MTLVLGGAASGKSEYAESLVLRTTGPRYYLATMQVWDAECAARVEKHRKMRAAKQFETVECPLHLGNVSLPARGTALLEDLGNLAANELYDPAGAGENAAKAILHGLEKPCSPVRKTSSLFPTRCSAAGPTMPVTQAAICWHWRR